jgi:hypothetical protein
MKAISLQAASASSSMQAARQVKADHNLSFLDVRVKKQTGRLLTESAKAWVSRLLLVPLNAIPASLAFWISGEICGISDSRKPAFIRTWMPLERYFERRNGAPPDSSQIDLAFVCP